ncbi:MAG: hypothetical protein IPL86_15670 [Flavobacteriales bacterium]|nr:hypothetical protein [Flavobacteriales bacterium]
MPTANTISTNKANNAQPVLKNTFTSNASTTTAAASRTSSNITKGPRKCRWFSHSARYALRAMRRRLIAQMRGIITTNVAMPAQI